MLSSDCFIKSIKSIPTPELADFIPAKIKGLNARITAVLDFPDVEANGSNTAPDEEEEKLPPFQAFNTTRTWTDMTNRKLNVHERQ